MPLSFKVNESYVVLRNNHLNEKHIYIRVDQNVQAYVAPCMYPWKPWKMPTYFYVKITHFPCMTRRMVAHFFYYGGLQIRQFWYFYRGSWELICYHGCLQCMVTMVSRMARRMDTMKTWRDVWLPWNIYGTTYGYQRTILGAAYKNWIIK